MTTLELVPIPPTEEELDLNRFGFGYNDVADTLYIHFFGNPQPAVSVVVNEFLYLRVNRATQKIVGLQIEDFLSYVVHEHPEWLPLADLAGIPIDVIESARKAISPERIRRAALLPILSELHFIAS